jgi:hypothetical protein
MGLEVGIDQAGIEFFAWADTGGLVVSAMLIPSAYSKGLDYFLI